MKKLSYKEQIELNEKLLDKIDLDKYIKEYEFVDDMFSAISDDYDDSDILPEEFQGCVFNFIDDYELGEYLAKRYNLDLREQFTSRYYLTGNNEG